ncbi:MAG: ATP-dependent helicase [Propionibacteriaceae bacterium]|nr:ATP-dependent helicase [Propionibacteriaceae bacterium]
MFDFGPANEQQREAISTVDGPVLVTAGPGTGKTFTLVMRAIYLIQERGVAPEQLLMTTFTEKAAKELVTRITNELAARGISVNLNEMYISTFHSLCLRIIKENLEYSRLKKNFRTLDGFDQSYLVFQNIHRFRALEGFDDLFNQPTGAWRQSNQICQMVNTLAEELVEPAALMADADPKIAALGRVLAKYQAILAEENLVDFSGLQTEAYHLLTTHPDVLATLQDRVRYLMVDEYQDTNYIQEQIVFLLGGQRNNICVVGDDDQGLYRFRGATIRNILQFQGHAIQLKINYRSNSDIVDFYNEWMATTKGAKFAFEWKDFRHAKALQAEQPSSLTSKAVVRLESQYDEHEWSQRIVAFIEALKGSGKLRDYNQIAFLFNSVKHERVATLALFLEASGISVYSPRSNMFFERTEVRTALGCMLLMLPDHIRRIGAQEFPNLPPMDADYLLGCVETANEVLSQPEHEDLLKWIRRKGRAHVGLTGTTDYAYSGLFYQLMEFEPFRSILDTDISGGVVDTRAVRNLGLLTQILGKFEYLHRIDVFNAKYLARDTERLFNLYLRLLRDGGIGEYEDDAEYAPSGCVSFLTIHQAKGMEFPIVIVDSLASVPRSQGTALMQEIERRYFKRPPFEPHDQMKFFDFWRLYYTAFSRAQDLLVLTCNRTSGRWPTPSKYFTAAFDKLPDVATLDLGEFTFHDVKDVNLKESFSFTSHITVYETCALQYKFYKELAFSPVRASTMLFGLLVHQTIEDIHRAAIRGEEPQITPDNISAWFDANYASLIQRERSYLAEPARLAALKQVLTYAERQAGRWDLIKQAEVDVSLVKPDYIIEGTIDLIKGEGDTVELVDFKAERKPDLFSDAERLERYRRQLHIYAHLVEQRYSAKVSKLHVYYTGEADGVPTITWPYSTTAVEATAQVFDETVHRILANYFCHTAASPKTCENCDFRFYCRTAIGGSTR